MNDYATVLQARMTALHDNRLFKISVIGVITLSALVIGVRTYETHPRWTSLLALLDNAVTLFFLAEILIRMSAEKQGLLAFFRKGWNVFDFVIVTASLIPVDGSRMVLLGRLLRVFRVLRLVSVVPDLRILLAALAKAIPRMGYVALLMFIIFYIYGAIGSVLFGRINETLWGDIGIAMLTLFRVVTFEDWTDIMYETMDVYPVSWLYYLSFIFLAAFVFLNMMIGIVVDAMQREHATFAQTVGDSGETPVPNTETTSALILQKLEIIDRKLDEIPGR